MEIRLGLCKRIFYFSFFPYSAFFMFIVQNDLFGNLIWIFSSLTTAFFLAICCSTDICPMDFSSGEFWRCAHSYWGKKEKITVSSYSHPLAPISRNSTLKRRPVTEHWLLSVTKWITIIWRIDESYGDAAVTGAQSVQLDGCTNHRLSP